MQYRTCCVSIVTLCINASMTLSWPVTDIGYERAEKYLAILSFRERSAGALVNRDS